MNRIVTRMRKLRRLMELRGIDAMLIPTSDYHESEYVSDYFACREYMTGFTGSAGTALIMKEWAGLWTDGRYFVQAEAQLADTGIELMRMGQPGVPKLEEYLLRHLPVGGTLAFDGRVVSAEEGERFEKLLKDREITLAFNEPLVDEIWEDRPALPAEPIWILEEKYTGKSAALKIADLRAEMERVHADVHVLTTLDDIAWLLNIRGNDVPYNPVVLSYLAVTGTEISLFLNETVVSDEVRVYLDGLGVTVCPYDDIYEYVRRLRDVKILLEKGRVNDAIVRSVDESNDIINCMNPTVQAKAKKTQVEIRNMKAAHVRDGVAMTRFIYWMKQNVGKIPMTECLVADRLDQMRRECGALQPSFATISAYGENAAMCHYHAEPESCKRIEPRGLYLVDSGGQYLEGTTDITRTFALGPVTEEERFHYTLVLISMLRLGQVRFLRGASGLTLDFAAREPLWKYGLDFNHGTGHGVGYLLNVHERPVRICFRTGSGQQDNMSFEPGMVCSDEPGIYIEGRHGIRTENLVYCLEDGETEYGQFLRFEYLTLVPIDLEPLDVSLMEPRDIVALNEYHEKVFEKIAPHLTDEEAEWLYQVTRPVDEKSGSVVGQG
ncbi:MAG: aminopeptidase P family protein [Clostridiales bacterium]|nr:aminopeptidase P family protein [Clostridiales bacterium]